jgi:flagellar protein FlaG
MLNSSLDAYKSVSKPAGSHHIAASHIALVSPSAQQPAEKIASKQATPVDQEVLTSAVKKLNEYVAPALQTIEFALDSESNRMIVKVVDTATQKILRQIPNEEVMAMSKTLDKLQGLVIRQTA